MAGNLTRHLNNLKTSVEKRAGSSTQETTTTGEKCSARSNNTWYGLDLSWHPELLEAKAKVTRWHNERRLAIVLAGDTGCGKTHIAKLILRMSGGPIAMIEPDPETGRLQTVRNAIFYEEAVLLSDIRSSYGGEGAKSEAIIGQCRNARLLILDDVGVAHVKEDSQTWYEDIMWRIFNNRAERRLRTMITTNLTPPELAARLGKRAFSRLKGMLETDEFFVGMFHVPDYRGKNWGK